MSVEATYYDGRTAKGHDVELTVEGHQLRICGEDITREYPLDRVELNAPLARTSRCVMLPDGSQCEVIDSAALDTLIADHRRTAWATWWVDRLEQRMSYAIAALTALALVIFLIVNYALPFASKMVAGRLSPSLEARLGEQSLAALDRLAFGPTTLGDARRRQLATRFSRLNTLTGEKVAARLEFRSSPVVGPNAFTLPGPIVVVLDQLVAFAVDDEEVSAVMAHELGHVHERHTLRAALQNSTTVLLMSALFGDLVSASSFASALPIIALEAAYSRDFEREADTYAVELMGKAGIARERYAALLQRLEHRVQDSRERYPDFLKSHPSTAERIQRTLSNSRTPDD